MGESAEQGWEEEGHCAPTRLPSPRGSKGCRCKEVLLYVLSPKVQELAIGALPGMFSLVSVTCLSFAECYLPIAAWEIGNIKESSPISQMEEGQRLAWVWAWLGALGRLFLPSPFLGTVPRSMTPSTTVSSILRNPIYTVRSHRVGLCTSPPVPREMTPQGLQPRYVKLPHTSLHPTHLSPPGHKATGA